MLLKMPLFHSFLWLSNMYHIFIHSSVDGHFGYFHVLVFVYSVLQWTLEYIYLLCVCVLGPHQRHMVVIRLGVQSELKPLAYTTATAMPGSSHVCNLHHSSWQHWILKPLSKARDWTCILMDASQIHFCWAMKGTPHVSFWVMVFSG